MKALFMRNGDVRIIDSYDTSEVSGEVYQYWCLPLGMQYKNQMDTEVQSFDKILRYSPDIAFEYKSSYLFTIVDAIKNWTNVSEKSITDTIIHHFISVDFTVHSNILEHIIEVIHGVPVWICLEEEDDSIVYSIRFKANNL